MDIRDYLMRLYNVFHLTGNHIMAENILDKLQMLDSLPDAPMHYSDKIESKTQLGYGLGMNPKYGQRYEGTGLIPEALPPLNTEIPSFKPNPMKTHDPMDIDGLYDPVLRQAELPFWLKRRIG